MKFLLDKPDSKRYGGGESIEEKAYGQCQSSRREEGEERRVLHTPERHRGRNEALQEALRGKAGLLQLR